MSYPEWIELVPSGLSAIAAVAAAIAAFGSLKVSKDSKDVAKQSALAVHHGNAASTLTEVRSALAQDLESLSSLADAVCVAWASEIETNSSPEAGGTDPRPLRHVLSNGSEMLAWHASGRGKSYRDSGRSIYSIVRDGIGQISESEYRYLLNKADGTYSSFEATFGAPSLNKQIKSSLAFRWVYYQLVKRVSVDAWSEIWSEAWRAGGCLAEFRAESESVNPLILSSLARLKQERDRLEHTVFPLDRNPELHRRYCRAIDILEGVFEDGFGLWEGHIDRPHPDDLVLLILYSMGIATLVCKASDDLIHGE